MVFAMPCKFSFWKITNSSCIFTSCPQNAMKKSQTLAVSSAIHGFGRAFFSQFAEKGKKAAQKSPQR
jgi:hypothetical protein